MSPPQATLVFSPSPIRFRLLCIQKGECFWSLVPLLLLSNTGFTLHLHQLYKPGSGLPGVHLQGLSHPLVRHDGWLQWHRCHKQAQTLKLRLNSGCMSQLLCTLAQSYVIAGACHMWQSHCHMCYFDVKVGRLRHNRALLLFHFSPAAVIQNNIFHQFQFEIFSNLEPFLGTRLASQQEGLHLDVPVSSLSHIMVSPSTKIGMGNWKYPFQNMQII